MIGLVVTGLAGRTLLDVQPPTPAESASQTKSRPRRLDGHTRRLVIVFGLIALCTAYGEGALADWSALHLEQDLHASPGVAAAGFSCFALAMAVGRFTGTRMLERLGQTRTLVFGGATAAVGMLVGALAPSLWAALLGFVVTGLGLANLFPIAVERAGALAGPRESRSRPRSATAACCWGRPPSASWRTGSHFPPPSPALPHWPPRQPSSDSSPDARQSTDATPRGDGP